MRVRLGRMLKRCAAVMVILMIAAAAFFTVKGYLMHKKAVGEYPVEKMVSDAVGQESFAGYEELPEIYIAAVISAEDKRFMRHKGIDCIATGRALLKDALSLSFAEGGSTITQQLAKNQYYTQEKRIERKVAEVFTASEIEKCCDKKTIFELYVNTIYFGSGYYGIYDAAQGYFGKTPAELSAYEAVMLAGVPNAPSVYSPNADAGLAEKRMRVVLEQMVGCDVISRQEAEEIMRNG